MIVYLCVNVFLVVMFGGFVYNVFLCLNFLLSFSVMSCMDLVVTVAVYRTTATFDAHVSS